MQAKYYTLARIKEPIYIDPDRSKAEQERIREQRREAKSAYQQDEPVNSDNDSGTSSPSKSFKCYENLV